MLASLTHFFWVGYGLFLLNFEYFLYHREFQPFNYDICCIYFLSVYHWTEFTHSVLCVCCYCCHTGMDMGVYVCVCVCTCVCNWICQSCLWLQPDWIIVKKKKKPCPTSRLKNTLLIFSFGIFIISFTLFLSLIHLELILVRYRLNFTFVQ